MITKMIIFLGLSLLIYWMAPKIKINPRVISENEKIFKLPDDVNRISWENAVRKFENKIVQPESFTHDPETGDIYTGTFEGIIWKINSELTKAEPIIRIGEEHLNCGSESVAKQCGRVLGLKFLKPHKLIAICAYNGIFAIDLKQKSKELLVGPDAPIKLVGLFNSIDITKSGILYFTISSKKWAPDLFLYGLLDSDDTGAVFSYDLTTKELKEIVNNISYANGIIVTTDENSLIVSEFFRKRLLKINLSEKNLKTTIFLDSFPGFTDNIQKDTLGNFYVAVIVMDIMTYLYDHPSISSAVAWWIPKWIINSLGNVNSHIYIINGQGKIISVIDDPRLGMEIISEAYKINNKILIGSFQSPHLDIIYLK